MEWTSKRSYLPRFILLSRNCAWFCRVLEQVNFEKKFSSLPQFKPEECQSPSAISVPSSPRVFNYPKKRNMTSGHRSSLDEEMEVETPQSACKSASGSRHVIGNTFFGPDFNIESVKGGCFFFSCLFKFIVIVTF